MFSCILIKIWVSIIATDLKIIPILDAGCSTLNTDGYDWGKNVWENIFWTLLMEGCGGDCVSLSRTEPGNQITTILKTKLVCKNKTCIICPLSHRFLSIWKIIQYYYKILNVTNNLQIFQIHHTIINSQQLIIYYNVINF